MLAVMATTVLHGNMILKGQPKSEEMVLVRMRFKSMCGFTKQE